MGSFEQGGPFPLYSNTNGSEGYPRETQVPTRIETDIPAQQTGRAISQRPATAPAHTYNLSEPSASQQDTEKAPPMVTERFELFSPRSVRRSVLRRDRRPC